MFNVLSTCSAIRLFFLGPDLWRIIEVLLHQFEVISARHVTLLQYGLTVSGLDSDVDATQYTQDTSWTSTSVEFGISDTLLFLFFVYRNLLWF